MSATQENLHFLDYWQVLRSRKEIVVAAALLVIATGIVVTLTLPKTYMASTLVLVKEETPDVDVWSKEIGSYDPLYQRTQFEIIQSRPVLEEVIQRLNLVDEFGRAYDFSGWTADRALERTLKILGRRMKVQQYRDTHLIEIQIYLSEPKETCPQLAADVANMVADVYRDQSMTRLQGTVETALESLNRSLNEQRQKTIDAEKKVEEMRQRYKIDVVTPLYGTESTLDKISMTHLEGERIRVRLELEDKKARYEKLTSMKPEDMRDAAPYVAGDEALALLISEKRKAEVELSELIKAALGPMHPDVVKAQASVREIEAKIKEALIGLKTGLLADFEAAQAKLDALEKEVEKVRSSERAREGSGYREFDRAMEELEQSRKIRDALEVRYMQERIQLRIPRTIVEKIEPAKAQERDDPASPNYLLNILLSIVVGLSCGIGLAYFVEYLDTSVKTIEEVEKDMGVSVLGVIPQKVKPFIDEGADTAHAEAYRVLRTNIQFSDTMKGGHALCVTSGSMGEGKSLTLFNLAYVYAQLGDRVLIVDSDLHRPRQHRILGITNSLGLANILVGDAKIEEAIVGTQVSNMDFLPSGRLQTEVHGLLDSKAMREVVKQLKESYDMVFFDSPPMIGMSDASLLTREVDGVLLVIQHRKYPKVVSHRAKDMILKAGARLIGVVLNNINITKDHSYYYYHQHYYAQPDRSGRKKERDAEIA